MLFVPFGDASNGGTVDMSPGPPSRPRPLVVNWHGCNRHLPVADYHADISRMNERAADYRWISITPVGTVFDEASTTAPYGWNADGCCAGCHGALVDDVAFATAILDWAESNLCVDTSRIFTTGFSNGGFMAYTTACALPGRIAGVAANAGSLARTAVPRCAALRNAPIPAISFHSVTDTYVPFNGTATAASQPEIDAMFRKRAGCNGSERVETVLKTATTICTRTMCGGGPGGGGSGLATPVEGCRLLGGLNHCWIGGRSGGFDKPGDCRARPSDVDATSRMFAFWSNATNTTNPPWIKKA